jgi:formylglycine-generating enzyme required for sulfatase activity
MGSPDGKTRALNLDGTLKAGAPSGAEEHRNDDEGPQHDVKFSRLFAVGRFPVTFAEWDECVKEKGCDNYRPKDQGWGRGGQPVINVSWIDAKAYVNWLSKKTAHTYRLLSEAEREYAARAGTVTPFWLGSTILTKDANFNGGDKGEYRRRTASVQTFEPNNWGLYQVHGNVWEWVEDCWHDSYNGAPADGSAWTTEGDCARRVLRGGSWANAQYLLRSAMRGSYGQEKRISNAGFRVAITVPEKEAAAK